jgi:hypothetical protein
MDEEENVAPEFQRATEGLEEGLETCQKILADYRSALLGLNAHDPVADCQTPEA